MQARAFCTTPIDHKAASLKGKAKNAAAVAAATSEPKISASKFSSFGSQENVAKLVKFARMDRIEVEDKLGDTMVIPPCSRTSTSDSL